jgi:AP2 domain
MRIKRARTSEDARTALIAQRHGNSSRYKGVSVTPGGKWRAQIFVDGRLVNLGRYRFETDAAIAYNYHALHYFGEFARLNDFSNIEYMHD